MIEYLYMKNAILLFITLAILVAVTWVTILYSDGYRINNRLISSRHSDTESANIILKTGLLAVRSIPEGAKVFINNSNQAVTATDDTIASLKPGKYTIRLEKEGFESWTKEVNVYAELVTDITAVLVLQSPKLEPLTNVDVKAFDISNDQNKIAFITKNTHKSGIWILPLTGSQINLFKNDLKVLIEDNIYGNPSLGERITWSPTDKQLLVQMNTKGYLLYDIFNQTNSSLIPKTFTTPSIIDKEWNEEWKKEFLNNAIEQVKMQYPPEYILDQLINKEVKWSPDFNKFYYISPDKSNPDINNVIVYNAEDPLPVDEKRIYFTFNISKTSDIKLYWYSDSYHFIVVEKDISSKKYYTISLVRIDGSNKTIIYNGSLASDRAYSNPYGDKVIVLTSLKEGSPNNLYAIAIR